MPASQPDKAIAIVGMGCRFPGGADSPAAFWDLLTRGADAIVEVPRDRWNIDRFYDPDPAKPGKMYVRAGGFLKERIDQFDAHFFGMSPREAAFVDPQQRFLLEVAWEALEDAGLVPEALAGSDTGVYVGAFMLDNFVTQLNPLNRARIGTHTAVGITMSILSNRLSYVFDLRGPSVSVDTACSSSLVAFHQACQAIRHEECSLALAGGVNIMHRPEIPISMCKGGFLSRDGRCKSFDARGDGYGRGEGAGVVVLKPLTAALRDGDHIYAVVRGTGVNQDGRTDGITVPNPEAQEALIRTVCHRAGVDPRSVRYVEAHGTGTALGDPLETSALGAVIGRGRSAEDACLVGSVKANIGHLEAASGIAGVIKSALCLKHGQIPPLANLDTPNPKIRFEELGLRLPLRLEPMPAGEGPARVGINSFGYGGTNAHAILQEAPYADRGADVEQDSATTLHLLPLSARSKGALNDLAKAYDEHLGAPGAPPLHDVCYSAAVRRGHHDHRLAIVADSAEEMRRQLQVFAAQGPAKGMAAGSCDAKGHKPVFVFTGMGPQWWAMGRELLETEPLFRSLAEECDAMFRRLADWSVLAEMLADEPSSRMSETQVAQPANFIVQVGLAARWRAWGIDPAAVVGHSVGEVAAAYVSGVLSLEDAVRVSFERSRIQKKAAGLGTMLAVGLSADEAEHLAAEHEGRVSLAAANGPRAVTLAGDAKSLAEIAARLQEQGVFNRFLQVEVAYHSPYMDPLLPELRESLAGLTLQAPTTPVYSTVTGAPAEAGAFDASYWCLNVRQPVYFATAMNRLIRDGYRIFLEIGPHPVLSPSIKQCLAEAGVEATILTSLRRDQPERRTLLEAFGGLYAAGSPADWGRFHRRGGHYVRLPTYPWQRETHWQETEAGRLDRLGAVDHALLGRRTAGPDAAWESALNGRLLPWLGDHRVEDLLVLPGAAYVELGLAIHHELSGHAHGVLEDLEFHKALVVEEGQEPALHVTYDDTTRLYAVYSRQGETTEWSLHARGTLCLTPPGAAARVPLREIQARCTEAIDAATHYDGMRARGLQYGPCFQAVRALWRRPVAGEALARIEAHEQVAGAEHRNRLHPTLLDACFQLLLATVGTEDRNVYVPVRIRQVRLRGTPPGPFWCHGKRTRRLDGALEGDITLFDDDGNVFAELRGVRAQALSRNRTDGLEDIDHWLYEFAWEKAPLDPPAEAAGQWLLFADGGEVGEALARDLEQAGAAVLRVRPGPCFAQSRGVYEVRPDSKSDLQRLLETVAPASIDHVAYLWGLDARTSDDDPVGTAAVVTALHLVQALTERPDAETLRLVVVTRDAQPGIPNAGDAELAQAPLVGLMRVVTQEHTELRSRVVDVDGSADTLALLGREVLSDSREEEVVLRGGDRYVHRLVRKTTRDMVAQRRSNVASWTNLQDEPADDAGGAGTQRRVRRPLAPHDVEVALRLAIPAAHGGMAEGVVVRVGAVVHHLQPGDRVVFTLAGELTPYATLPSASVYAKPALAAAHGPSAAAQLPAFVAATYALEDRARLEPGERVLIHGAEDAAGLAAVQTAQRAGAVVYATARGDEARERVRALGVADVFAWDSLEFADEITECTGGAGVDVVFNTLAGDAADRALPLLAPFGRFLDVRSGAVGPATRGEPLRANQSLSVIDVHSMGHEQPVLFTKLLAGVAARFRSGSFVPLPTRVARPAEWTEEASTSAATAVGVEAIAFAEGVLEPAARADAGLFREDASYLVTGGFGGFGLQIAAWMVLEGARHLVLVGRRGAQASEAQEAVRKLEEAGAQVVPVAADVAEEPHVKRLIEQIAGSMPPLRGVFHAAAVLQDGPISQVTPERLDKVMKPKAAGAWNLHRQTRHLPLDHFVLFSSVASLIGNPGQASYVAANTFLDALAHYRRSLNLAGISLNWGALADVGMVARDRGVEEHLRRVGLKSFTPAQAVAVLGQVLQWNPVELGVAIADWHLWGEFNPAWAASPRYADLLATETAGGASEENAVLQTLRQMPAAERPGTIASLIAELVAETLRLPLQQVDHGLSLLNMGVDSLMAMELQTAVEKKVGVKVSTLELMKGSSLAQLAQQIALRIDPHGPTAGGPEPKAAGTAAPRDNRKTEPARPVLRPEDLLTSEAWQIAARLEELSDDQVDELLARVQRNEEIQA
jgi:acyl transferase domain-containing protein/NADPH:quinone reductase-like Zn-dependent oxidoreductase/NADP-dependent 3-hydroxy acid dehydrogenase YdfG/acyl carrier protein